ncbi:beta-ketoacyl synthase N-terminal-like domain-containing protein [Mucisphaera calidilacus]|uniref:3-oxoacyl-[acyl-carrier-protein] synthase 2 n=1 Tax=Mucisphaera calidilacus TaxID=2527982 RepID=A0A518BZR0_9BACT|nr:beta-ketoacyl synthase N-terminal-like domain-containing protein [Mucisphaera calidilacus]QDU72455.1 3-oxoacyl-[acyl-carrier-protein] synthase 2 [Mucisphaera calidilacus]
MPSNPTPRRVRISGLGLVTPLGDGAWPTCRALLEGRRITDRAAELPDDTEPVSVARAIGCVAHAQHTATDPAVEIAERAAREAASDAGVDLHGLPTYLGTSKGAVLALTHPHEQQRSLAAALGPAGYLDHHLMLRTGIAVRGHWIAACASSLCALDAARRAIALGDTDRALVLTAESAMTPMFVHSYRRLGVLAPPTRDGYRETPLARRRGGFVLAELGAAVVLEAGEGPGPELLDTATAGEADNLVQPAPGMPALAHIAQQLLTSRTIDVLHPHAPGTEGHDPEELAVLEHATAHQHTPPALYACKGALGHGLGASGLVSLVLACLAMRTAQLPPMPWLTPDNTLEDTRLSIEPQGQRCSRHATHAIFAAGFAGHTAGAVIRNE